MDGRMVDNLKFKEFVKSQLPMELIKHLVFGINSIYSESYNEVFEKVEKEEAVDLLPIYRRAKIENFLKYIPNYFPAVNVRSETNHRNTSYFEVMTIGKMVITQSFCKYPTDNIRDA